jgi:hypothetical protein
MRVLCRGCTGAGGHFTAMETPSLLINDIRSFFAAI